MYCVAGALLQILVVEVENYPLKELERTLNHNTQ